MAQGCEGQWSHVAQSTFGAPRNLRSHSKCILVSHRTLAFHGTQFEKHWVTVFLQEVCAHVGFGGELLTWRPDLPSGSAGTRASR